MCRIGKNSQHRCKFAPSQVLKNSTLVCCGILWYLGQIGLFFVLWAIFCPLGDFLSFGRFFVLRAIFNFGNFLKTLQLAKNFRLFFFSKLKVYVLIFSKISFCAIFSQTLLVTLKPFFNQMKHIFSNQNILLNIEASIPK
jgi:hypothetical protein